MSQTFLLVKFHIFFVPEDGFRDEGVALVFDVAVCRTGFHGEDVGCAVLLKRELGKMLCWVKWGIVNWELCTRSEDAGNANNAEAEAKAGGCAEAD
jgi:hypothetical protein